MQLFARQGFHSTSVADLAEATGLTKGALYHHFENKDAIFYAVVEAIRNLWREVVVGDVLQAKDARERLDILFDNHVHLVCQNEVLCLSLTSMILEMNDVNPDFMAVLREIFADLTDFVEHIIKKGQVSGQLRPDLDSRLTALSIVAMLEGSVIPRIVNREELDYKALMMTMKQILLDSLEV